MQSLSNTKPDSSSAHHIRPTDLSTTSKTIEHNRLQLGLVSRHGSAHHIPNITRRLIEEESHALATQVLADDVELHAVLVDHVGDSVERRRISQ